MQVGMNALIAEEHGAFTIRDVMTELAKILIFRHPHVFLHTDAQTPQDALRAWDESKKQEKHQETCLETLKSVPVTFPPDMRAKKVVKRSLALNAEDNPLYESAIQSLAKAQNDYQKAGEALSKATDALITACANIEQQ